MGQTFGMMLNYNIIHLSKHLLSTLLMSCHITGIRIQKWKGHPAFEKLLVWWGRQIQKELQTCDWNELRTMKIWEKTINFTKVTWEDLREEVTFEKVWKDMEKDDLGRARRKWMSLGWGSLSTVCKGEEGRGLYQHMRWHLALHSLLLSLLWSAQPEKLNCFSSSFLSYIKAQFHLPMSINLMGYKCWVF